MPAARIPPGDSSGFSSRTEAQACPTRCWSTRAPTWSQRAAYTGCWAGPGWTCPAIAVLTEGGLVGVSGEWVVDEILVSRHS